MRYGMLGDNQLESLVLRAGLVATPMLEGYGVAFGRALTLGTRFGFFEVLAARPLSAAAVAQRCDTDPDATEKLLNLLVSMRYLTLSSDRYRLTRSARKWLLESSPRSVRDMVLMKELEWRWLDGLEEFVRTGRPLNIHATMSAEDWALYQRGMRAQARVIGGLVARRVPMPRGATRMLDVGGSHGYFSVALCRRYPGLRSIVLDLPEAVRHAAPLLEQEGMDDRVLFQPGNALTEDLGTDAYDLILIFSLVHHFDEATNRELVARCGRALRPGGRLVIGDVVRPKSPRKAGLDTFYDLYFALISESGLWRVDQIAEWQRAAGLRPRRAIRLVPGQGPALQAAERPLQQHV
jgi:SAM-dependent methyltransferase